MIFTSTNKNYEIFCTISEKTLKTVVSVYTSDGNAEVVTGNGADPRPADYVESYHSIIGTSLPMRTSRELDNVFNFNRSFKRF